MNFETALAEHLDAIERRDLAGYVATLHDDVTVVLPTGTVLAGRDEVAQFHQSWFASPTWRMEVAIERRHAVGRTGVALLATTYHDVDDAGAPVRRERWLGMTFAQVDDGRWLLVYDQNTTR